MDAQGRGHAGDIDPADQWVFNPSTGSYELRLNPVADDSPSQYGNSRPNAPRQRRSSRADPAAPSEPASSEPSADEGHEPRGRRHGEPRLPAQRRSRAAEKSGHAEGRGGGHGRRKAKRRLSGKQKALRWGGGIVGLVVIASCVGGYVFYQRLNGNINKVDVGMNNAAVTDGPVNILVIGTDARSGKGNTGYGDMGSVGHADTTFLFHVSEDRTNATALSIPRDMITDIPNCPTKQKDGSKKNIPGQQSQRFNTSLGQSGRDPGCTWRTVEKLTGVKINHFMMADFNAVKELSNAVGGVEVCAAKPINDPKSHLKLKAGKHTVKGEQALAFVRTRHAIGFGSDLDRIKLQQQFLSSMIRKMKSGDTLTSPSKLLDLSDVATKALTVDTGIGSVKKLMSLAQDLKRVNVKNITFATAPVVDNPDDPATVVLNEAKAKPLFKMVREDKSMTKVKKKNKGKSPAKAKKAPVSQVNVEVLNGGGTTGAASETVDWLTNKGAGKATAGGNAPQLKETKLEFAPSQEGQAARLADMMGLPASALKKSADGGSGKSMKLTLGEDFSGAGEPIEAPDKAPSGVEKVNANDKNVCAK
ncbi:LCP family protein [Streptomyces sp. NBC_01795]|uniref:LCP family protein n=1 Tax=unclassified Streptomyces TaxID=2593676 RepID=UPI002DDB9343|nr:MULTISPECIES: LCP family protein [unclassified Streptomyces]WSA94353.1 LCP family protein [Streptomyces sp. NBC_01795]WSB78771.1 LCP family protein [Streptomyces sp. NBC_01775]WSS13025.1 LCP family protein [Streptomyces sp. NBC_01186]